MPDDQPSPRPKRPHVLVVGGGFAGVACAKRLGRRGVDVTLIDKTTYHQFQPLLYQVATAQLSADDVRQPLRDLFRKLPSVDVRNAEIASVDPVARTVTTADGQTIEGDHLVLAVGSEANFFHVPGAEAHAFPLYTSDDAVRLRDRILRLFEDADLDPERIDQGALDFVVVGGGPTGVETAGALADLIHDVLPSYYNDLDVGRARVFIVDRANVLLRPFSEKAHGYVASTLERKGVTLRLDTAVGEIRDDRVVLGDGSEILTRCVVWAGGLKPRSIDGLSALPTGPRGRVEVAEDLSVPGFPGVYAVGDAALALDHDGTALPQLGSVALQAGRAAADTILAERDGTRTPTFRYHDKGIMAMIGRRAAVAEVGAHHHELHGSVAFGAWLGIHAWLLETTRTRIDAFVTWAWDWFTHSSDSAYIGRPDDVRIDWTEDNDTSDEESAT